MKSPITRAAQEVAEAIIRLNKTHQKYQLKMKQDMQNLDNANQWLLRKQAESIGIFPPLAAHEGKK